MLDLIRSWPVQMREGLGLGKIKIPGEIILVCGMGSSGLAGDILKELFFDQKITIVTHKDYGIPGWTNSKTTVFAVSYSGDTEEAISSYKEARMKGAKTIVFTSGGKLETIAQENNTPLVRIPKGLGSRASLPSLLFAMISVLQYSKLIALSEADVKTTINVLDNKGWEDKAKQLAEKISGMPVIYAGSGMSSIALRWQHSFNENAKIMAHSHTVPEMNHNELQAWSAKRGEYAIIIRGQESEQLRKRLDFLKELVKKNAAGASEVIITGHSNLTRMCSALYLGDLTGYFYAQRTGTDTLTSPLIDQLKRKL